MLGFAMPGALFFFFFLFAYVTDCHCWLCLLCHLLSVKLPPTLPWWLNQKLSSNLVISCPLLPVSRRWYSCNHYLSVRTVLHQHPHLRQHEELPSPVLSAMKKLFPDAVERRQIFSSCKSELLLRGASTIQAGLEHLRIFHWGWGNYL